jgi:hypothetical protein
MSQELTARPSLPPKATRYVTYSPRSTMPDSHHVRTPWERVTRPECPVAGLFRITIDSNLHAADLWKCEIALTHASRCVPAGLRK